jgi:hypothetical protein
MNGRWRLAARTTFAGSDGGAARWAIVASLLATAKLNDVEPFTYLKDILRTPVQWLSHGPARRPFARELDLNSCRRSLTHVSGIDAYAPP